MSLLNFSIASVVDGATGSHLNQTPHGTHHHKQRNIPTVQNHIPREGFLVKGYAVMTSLARNAIAAYRKRAQQRKDTIQLLGLNSHYMSDIGLTSQDFADLKSGQITLRSLNSRRDDNQEQSNLRLKRPNISKIKTSGLTAANQAPCELASCG